MNINYALNSGRQVFKGGQTAPVKQGERSGAVTGVSTEAQPKVRSYTVTVKGGELKITTPPRKSHGK
jgi:hypothetical protein